MPSSVGLLSNTPFFATGGTVTDSSGYRIHVFTGLETFTTNLAQGTKSVEVLMVAGGGGGGGNGGGGGGAGGVVYTAALSVSAGSSDYSISIGGGGVGAAGSLNGTNGTLTSMTGRTNAVGGGGGATRAITHHTASRLWRLWRGRRWPRCQCVFGGRWHGWSGQQRW
jgi:hypothetical protein